VYYICYYGAQLNETRLKSSILIYQKIVEQSQLTKGIVLDGVVSLDVPKEMIF